jgi:hypothetical protein
MDNKQSPGTPNRTTGSHATGSSRTTNFAAAAVVDPSTTIPAT